MLGGRGAEAGPGLSCAARLLRGWHPAALLLCCCHEALWFMPVLVLVTGAQPHSACLPACLPAAPAGKIIDADMVKPIKAPPPPPPGLPPPAGKSKKQAGAAARGTAAAAAAAAAGPPPLTKKQQRAAAARAAASASPSYASVSPSSGHSGQSGGGGGRDLMQGSTLKFPVGKRPVELQVRQRQQYSLREGQGRWHCWQRAQHGMAWHGMAWRFMAPHCGSSAHAAGSVAACLPAPAVLFEPSPPRCCRCLPALAACLPACPPACRCAQSL